MKKLFVLLLICISGGQLFSQSVAINNNGTAPDPTSMLDISSTTKGVLIPRMRTLERTAIVNPAEGLLVFDIDTRTFWFFSNSWNEIGVGGNGGQNGLATGDLSGTYPAPNVVKLQNLDVAFGVPLDKQVLKWDMQANTWKGMNDSLFLPYNSTFADAAKLFSITNTQTNNGATAIYGRSGNTGSGMIPVTPIAIWGDNSTGGGILGTSFNGVGTYGYSAQNHGVFGFTNGTAMAGVYGYNNNNGYGIMGENFVQGAALYGKAHGVKGKAALFENINLAGTDTVLKVTHAGLGPAGYFLKTATTDASTVLTAKTEGLGHGIEVTLPNVAATGQGIRVVHHGLGDGLFVAAKSGRAAYFANDMTNTSSVVEIHNTGTNKALQVGSVSTSSSNPSITVSHAGEASALMVTMYNNAALAPGINVQSSGQAGIAASATANNSIAVKGQTGANATGGIAVLGIAGANDASGIGVKGQSNSPSVEHGAITGINSSNGIGVFGQAAGNDGIGMYGRSGNGNSQTKAAVFENINASNTRPVVEVNTNGSGNAFAVNSTKVASNSPVVEVK
ncbi:MAG TPA: hypothetical protein VFX58_18290, partial [Chitinophagaceae bacterium]|nr:hypothetical protein [Chitinophagaceae bacterium]